MNSVSVLLYRRSPHLYMDLISILLTEKRDNRKKNKKNSNENKKNKNSKRKKEKQKNQLRKYVNVNGVCVRVFACTFVQYHWQKLLWMYATLPSDTGEGSVTTCKRLVLRYQPCWCGIIVILNIKPSESFLWMVLKFDSPRPLFHSERTLETPWTLS